MSTLVVARTNGSVAIGADTMTKLGYTRQPASYIADHSKLVRVGDSLVAVAGHASWGLVLASYFESLPKPPDLHSSRAIFEEARRLHAVLKERYYLNPSENEDDEFESSQYSCLIANPSGIYGLYSLRSVQEFTRYYAFGSGFKFALGAMRAVHEGAGSAEAVARIGLEAAAEFDEDTGLPVEVHAIELKAR